MTIPLYHAIAANALDPVAIFTRAQTAWVQRTQPSFESFTLPCGETFLANQCAAGATVQFIVRLGDGRTFAQTLDAQGRPATILLRGGYAMGPAGAPFGFYRRAPRPGANAAAPPPNLAPDPLATIAVVAAVDHAYAVTLDGIVTLGAHACYHLHLRPLRDAQAYPLRELWIDTATYDVRRLRYTWPYNDITTDVTYDFAPIGPNAIWCIVHIDARAISHGLFTSHVEHVGEDLHDIAFPVNVPADDFEPTPR